MKRPEFLQEFCFSICFETVVKLLAFLKSCYFSLSRVLTGIRLHGHEIWQIDRLEAFLRLLLIENRLQLYYVDDSQLNLEVNISVVDIQVLQVNPILEFATNAALLCFCSYLWSLLPFSLSKTDLSTMS